MSDVEIICRTNIAGADKADDMTFGETYTVGEAYAARLIERELAEPVDPDAWEARMKKNEKTEPPKTETKTTATREKRTTAIAAKITRR